MDALIADFNSIYPNITVELNTYNNNSDGNMSVNTSILAGEVDVLAGKVLVDEEDAHDAGQYRDVPELQEALVAVPAVAVSALLFTGCTADAWPQLAPSATPSPSATVVAPKDQESPVVTEAQAERIARHETARARRRIAAGEPVDVALDEFAHQLANKFLHAPFAALNAAGADEQEELVKLIRRLYRLHDQE